VRRIFFQVYVSTLYLMPAGLLVMALALQGGTAAYLASALITLGIGMFSLRPLRNIVSHTNPAWGLNLMPKSLTG
jgi:hypothetical protein